MERLTKRDEYGNADIIGVSSDVQFNLEFDELNAVTAALNRLAAYEDTGLAPKDCATYKKFEDNLCASGVPFSRIIELVNAEKEGRCVTLPCKVGDIVYQTDGTRIYKLTVRGIIYNAEHIGFDDSAVGKSIFLTREEAQAALKEREDRP